MSFVRQRLAELGLNDLDTLLGSFKEYPLWLFTSTAKAPDLRRKSEVRVYDAHQLVDLWRHVYGSEWRWDGDVSKQSTISKGHRVELRGITLHE